MQSTSTLYHNVLTMVMMLATLVAFWPISVAMAILTTAATLFIAFLCPFWLLYVQQYKRWVSKKVIVTLGREISGPWDIARVQALH